MKRRVRNILIALAFLMLIITIIAIFNVKKSVTASSEVLEEQNEENIDDNNVDLNNTVDNNIIENNETTNTDELPKNNEDNKGVIYLTFDDGPSISSTPKILDILKEEDVKATFFIVNYNTEKEELIKREIEEGHSVGIHGYSHEYKEIYKTEDAYMENLNKLQEKIEQSTGVKTTITRFPGGSSNTISKFNKGIMTRLTKLVEESGYKYYDWNIDSDDAGSAKNKKQVYNNVTKSLSKKRANVVLMHDFANNEKTINALKSIIKYGKENEYEFRSITADSSLVMHHRILN